MRWVERPGGVRVSPPLGGDEQRESPVADMPPDSQPAGRPSAATGAPRYSLQLLSPGDHVPRALAP